MFTCFHGPKGGGTGRDCLGAKSLSGRSKWGNKRHIRGVSSFNLPQANRTSKGRDLQSDAKFLTDPPQISSHLLSALGVEGNRLAVGKAKGAIYDGD